MSKIYLIFVFYYIVNGAGTIVCCYFFRIGSDNNDTGTGLKNT